MVAVWEGWYSTSSMESECEGGATVGGGRRIVGLGHSRSRERRKNEGNVEVASIVSGVAKRVEKSGSAGAWGCTGK